MTFGVILLSIVVALGCEWAGRKVRPKKAGAAAAGGGAGGPGGPGGSNAMAIFRHWGAGAAFLVSGVAWASALWPLVAKVEWKWLVLVGVFAGIILGIGTIIDVIQDKKPDGMAYVTARLFPLLLLVVVAHWATFTGVLGDQFSTYQQNIVKSSTK